MVCTACGKIHYVNPLPIVGCLVERDDEVLLCRRAIEPALGKWTPPAGFLELGESSLDGARRETFEEAGAEVEIIAPHAHLDLPHIGQTYFWYRARLRAPLQPPGAESSEVRWFRYDALPWDELAFPVVHEGLRLRVADRDAAATHMHLGVLVWRGSGSRYCASNYDLRDHLELPLGAP